MKHSLRPTFLGALSNLLAIKKLLVFLLIFISYFQSYASPDCPIINERFQGLADGTTINNSATGWYLDASHVVGTGYFAMKSNRFHAQEIGGEGIWYSKVFSVASYTNIQVATKITTEGDQNSTEYVRVYYKLNGGSEVLIDQRTGSFGTIDFVSPMVTGNTIQIVVKIYNFNNGGSQTSKTYIEDYRVFKEVGPCNSTAPVITAATSGALNCTNPSVTLTATSNISGTTYLWSGPSSFSSTSQNPVVTIPGSYTVVGTANGLSSSATVAVTQNTTPPAVTATGATLGCSGGATLSASSSVSGAQYSWIGPGSFTSSLQNPTVNAIGSYTVTVRDPANGCTNSQTVQVTAGTGTSTLWTEDFAFANGTTVDNGSTSWSVVNTSSGTFNVNTNEFRVNNIGSSTEGVWTSGSVDISSQTNVTVAIDLRSGVSSGGALESSGSGLDYIRIYYKLNNGAEVLLGEQLGAINSNSSTNTTVSVGSLSGSSLQIVVRSRTTSSDEFYYFDNVRVTASGASTISATASASGSLSCSNTSVTLNGSSTTPGVTYSWSGPGFTSTLQNPAISVPGNYTLTVTSNTGCTGTATVNVTQNISTPGASASSSGNLTCSITSRTLSGSSTTSGVTYSWSGPGFTSALQNPTISAPGTYTLTVANPTNGCTSTASVVVTSTSSLAVTASSSRVIDCGGELTTLSTNISGGAYNWSGPGGFSSSSSAPTTRVPGTYTVTVTKDGCSGSANVNVIMRPSPGVLATGGSIGCSSTPVTLSATSTVSGVTYSWAGPSGFTPTNQQNPVTSIPGTYTVVATDPVTGCTSTSKVNVTSGTSSTVWLENFNDLPNGTTVDNGATAWSRDVSGTNISTNGGHFEVRSNIFSAHYLEGQAIWRSQVVNIGSVTNASISFDLSGEGSLNTGGSNIDYFRAYYKLNGGAEILFHDGIYSMSFNAVTVSSPVLNGSNLQIIIRTSITGFEEYFRIDNVKITGSSSTLPATASVDNTLTCSRSQVTLTTNVSASGTTYSWSGPGGFTSSDASPSVGQAGSYTVNVSNSSGCSGSATVTVIQDGSSPGGSATGGTITCNNPIATLSASSPTSGVTYLWSGPSGFSSNSQTTTTTLPGTYSVIITNPTNGCQASATATVVSSTTLPEGTATASGTLSCTSSAVTLTGSSSTPGVTYLWSGPGGFSSSSATVSVSVPGIYNLLINVPSTGCSVTRVVTVLQNSSAPGASASVSGELTCNGAPVTLAGTSPTSGVNFSWTGPGGFTSSLSNPSVLVPGTYNLVVANPVNGCASSATVNVIQNSSSGGVTASVSGPLSCTVSNVTLTATSSIPGATYNWSGPGGFTASSSTTTTGMAGTYTVIATNPANGCTSTASVQVIQNGSVPTGVVTHVSDTIDCLTASVVLSATSSTSGVSFRWTGPGGFVANTSIATTTTPGFYTLTVTNVSNGCSFSTSVQVMSNIVFPGATIDIPTHIISCVAPVVTLTGSSPTAGVNYVWSGPGGFTSFTPVISVSLPGVYILTVTNPINGCATSTAENVYEDKNPPTGVTANKSGDISCLVNSVTLTGASTTSGAIFAWSGPSGFTANTAVATTNIPGTYTLVVTHPVSTCTVTRTVEVFQNSILPAVSINVSNSGILTCNITSITITGSSTTSGVTYQWAGPGGFSANTSTINVTTPGSYTLTVTNPANGCSATASTIITQDGGQPIGVFATKSGDLTCINTSVTLTATSTTPGVTYAWAGPGGFSATGSLVTVTNPGTYTLTVTNPSNGCVTSSSVSVIRDITPPSAVAASKSGDLSCATSSVTLTGTSTTSGVNYHWSGPGGFNANTAIATATNPGTYTLTVTNPVNGCFATATISILNDISTPTGVTAIKSGDLSCLTTTVTLTGSSSTSGSTFSWSGPSGFSANTASTTATLAGTYTLTVTNPINGCKATASVTVNTNSSNPIGVTAVKSGDLTCSTTSVILTGSSTTTGVTYSWSGPSGFTSNTVTASVTTPGTYTLTVTNPVNGCFSTANVTVNFNGTPPGALASKSGDLSCLTTSVTLTGTSPTSGATFTWTGPGLFTVGPVVSVALPGTYVLTVTNPVNGCTSTSSLNVILNNIPPADAAATKSGDLTCTVTSVTLTGTSTTPGVTYSWSGPSGFSANTAVANVSLPGTYTLIVRDPLTGCSVTRTVTVIQSTIIPTVSVSKSGDLTCTVSFVTLTGSSTTSGVTYSWTGPSGFSASTPTVTVTAGGTYILTVTNATTGCSASSTPVVVNQNSSPPGALAVVGPSLDCNVLSITLQGSSPTSGVTYSWTGTGGFSSTVQNPIVTSLGSYILTVTNPANGCTSKDTVDVLQNAAQPDAHASVMDTLSCRVGSVQLFGSSTTPGVTYTWTAAGGYVSFEQNPIVTVGGGYTLIVTNPVTGCATSTTLAVPSNIQKPGATAFASGVINCITSTVTLSATSPTPGVTYSWTGPGTFSSTGQTASTSVPGFYYLTVINPANNCVSQDTIEIKSNILLPGVVATPSSAIDCNTLVVTLNASSPTPGVTYRWVGPGGFASSIQNPVVAVPGLYTLTVTNPANNCKSSTTVNVIQNNLPPGVVANVSGKINCVTNSVTLTGTSPSAGVSFTWTGPGGFTSNLPTVTTSIAGTYILTVNNPSTGCTSTTIIQVEKDQTIPDVLASVSGNLSCDSSLVTLTAASSIAGATYSWTGPGGFTSTLQNPQAGVAGTYIVTITHPSSGCTSNSQVDVLQDSDVPDLFVFATGTLSCTTSEVVLFAFSGTSGVTFNWTGPNGFTSNLDMPTVSEPGVYTVTATNPIGGCTATNSLVLELDTLTPQELTVTVSDTLTCSVTSVTLTASSTTSGVNYNWTGPNGFTSTENAPVVSEPGVYTVIATNSANGCTATASIEVIRNTSLPLISLSVSDILNCVNTTSTITGSSTTAGVIYGWSGPNGFGASTPVVTVSLPGTYILTVTDSASGCQSSDSVVVQQDITSPMASAAILDTLTCTNTAVTLLGSSPTPDVAFRWTTLGGIEVSTAQNAPVSTPGIYILTVTHPFSLCSSYDTVEVIQNIEEPGVSASVSGVISCAVSTVTLTGTSPASGVSFLWTGPGGFTANTAVATASVQGDYILTVTDTTNGCQSSIIVKVNENFQQPFVVLLVSNELTCNTPSATLSTTLLTTSGFSFRWTGPSSFVSTSPQPVVSLAGTYYLTLTDSINGCSTTDSIDVQENRQLPGAIASASDSLSCVTSIVNLTGISSATTVTFAWSGPGGFNAVGASVSVTTPGDYILTVTNVLNGCISRDTVTVIENLTPPDATASVSGPITCANPSVTLNIVSVSGATFSWTGPGGFASALSNPVTNVPGVYNVTVTNPANGCTSTASVTVIQNIVTPGVTASVAEVLTCSTTSVTITATSPTSGTTFVWSGPGGFTASSATTSATLPGLYIVEATNPVNGCTSSDTINVVQDLTGPGATASVSGILTCSDTTVVLAAASPASGVNFSWTGPAGFSSTLTNPTVSNPGIYILTATSSVTGCSSVDSVNVGQDITAPNATASVSGVLNCSGNLVTLTGSSTTIGVTYAWSGPNGFTANTAVTTASLPGTYTLTVTSTANGCQSVFAINVLQNITPPGAVASVSGALTCADLSVTLSGSSSTSSVTYSWSGPGSFASSLQNPVISIPGQYILTVTDTINLCTSIDTIDVQQNIIQPNISASTSGILTCSVTSVALVGTSTTSGTIFNWTGPNGYTASTATATTSAPGDYTLTVTDTLNGCTSTQIVNVQQNIQTPVITASVSGVITCTTPSVTLSAAAITSGFTFNWSGPNGFTSQSATPSVSLPGTYFVTVTDTINGCSSSDSVDVLQNIALPGAIASVSGNITCTTAEVTLTGSSSDTGAIFTWTGPGGFTATGATATATLPGNYILFATGINGCVSSDTIEVIEDRAAPGATAVASSSLTCSTTTITLSAITSTSGATFSWTGPSGFTSTLENPTTSVPGIYILTVTNPVNGCSSADSVDVLQDITLPLAVVAAVSDTLTCTVTSVTLTGSSSTPGVTYNWSGPSGFLSNVAVVSITSPGTYILTVTNPLSACFVRDTVEVIQNITPPADVVTLVSGILTCSDTSITITASSSTSGVTFSWSGPGGFASVSNAPSVTVPGTYTLTVTNPENGCTVVRDVEVIQNIEVPNVSASASGILNCLIDTVTLSGNSTTPGSVFSWSGPNGFTDSTAVTTASLPGTYTLTVTNPVNGCFATFNVEVEQNITPPLAVASSPDTLTCTNTTVSILGSSPTSGVIYSWSGPAGFATTIQNPTASLPGEYILTVTNPANGCISRDTIQVIQNIVAPNISASVSGVLNCEVDTVIITGTSSTIGVVFQWNGPSGYTAATASAFVTLPGTYTLTVTDTTNGCTSIASVEVIENIVRPTFAVLVSGVITCADASVTLSTSLLSTDGFIFNWSGPSGFSSALPAPTASLPGRYFVTVTDSINRCSTLDSIDVQQNIQTPGAIASVSGDITCNTATVNISGTSPTAGVSFSWTGPASFSSTDATATVSLPGNYILTVTDTVNGCISVDSINVIENIASPDLTVASSGSITCTNSLVTLVATSTVSGVTYSWTGPGGFNSTAPNPTVSAAGTYIITVTNSVNGCTSSDSVDVLENRSLPLAIASVSDSLTCTTTAVTLNATSNVASAKFAWEGPGGFVSNVASPSVNIQGLYILTVTDTINGCSSSDSIEVIQDIAEPLVTASVSDTLTCTDTVVTLFAASPASGVSFQWSGPAGFTSSVQNPTANLPGVYTVVATSNATGCTSTGTVEVFQNIIAPDATASVSSSLNCTHPTVTLAGTSLTPGVTFSWSGPGGFSANTASTTTNTPGIYSLTVINPANGCQLVINVNVIQNLDVPSATASVIDTLTCSRTKVTLFGSSTTTGVTYKWNGPGGLLSTAQNPEVSTPGIYILTVTNPLSECSSNDTIEVFQNIDAPIITASSVSGIISCTNATVTLTGASSTVGAIFQWTGPGGNTISNTSVATANAAGNYILSVTDPINGCVTTKIVNVQQSFDKPAIAVDASGVITCTSPQVILSNTLSSAGLILQWTGPAGFTSSSPTPSVSVAGRYYLLATDSISGCNSTDSVDVQENKVLPGVAIIKSGDITCLSQSVILTGSSPTSGVLFNWTGPAGITANTPNLNVVSAGRYRLNVTNPLTGCSSVDSVDVFDNSTLPNIVASVSGPINCINTSVTLTGSSTTPGVTYSWTGPGGFAVSTATATTSTAGTYVLKITNSATGCEATASVSVITNSTLPGSSISSSGILTCINTTVTLTGSSLTTGVTFSWTGPGGFTASTAVALATVPGAYVLVVTNPANGCKSTSTVNVNQLLTVPTGVVASKSGDLNCTIITATLTGSSSTPGATYSWSGPGGFTAATAVTTTTVPGTYTLTVRHPITGCTATASVIINQNITPPANVTASKSNDFTCINTAATLTGASSTVGVTYTWSGPGGFTANTASTTVSIAGTYTVTVRASNGCTATASVAVIQNTTPPANVIASKSGDLTCITTGVTLTGSSSTTGVTYQWTGPTGFPATSTAVATTSIPGTYTLVVTNPINGCKTTSTVTVNQNTTIPESVAISKSGDLTCSVSSVTLTASSSTSGATYSWSGPGGFSQTTSVVSVSLTGTYTVTVKHPTSGCTTTASIAVNLNNTPPAGVTATKSSDINCITSTITLTGSSSTIGVTYNWSGPGGLNVNTAVATTSNPGTYTLTVTDPTNGCTTTALVNVLINNTPPATVAATKSGDLTCTTTSVTLTGSSTTSGVTYSWTGPGSFTSSLQSPTVSTAGTYILTVTNPVNGCTSTASVTVIENIATPGATASVSGPITCTTTTVTLTGNSITTGVTYSWTGPGSFTSTSATPTVSVAGTYNLTVTDPVNGCTSTASVTVIENITTPGATASVSGPITCTTTTVTLTGNSLTPGVTYSWTGPGSFTSTSATPTVSVAGIYNLTVTDPTNGCTSTASVTVIENITAPGATATVSGPITCTTTTVTLTGSSITTGVTYSWTGPGSFTSTLATPTVSVAGTYNLTVTDPANGCTSTASVTVIENIATPGVTASVSGPITCTTTTVTLTGNSLTPGVTYSWTGPGSFTSTSATPTVSVAGTYNLTVTNLANGCTSTASVTVIENITAPGATASVSGPITCTTTTVTLTGNSLTPGVTYSWTGPGSFTSTSATPTVSVAGTYNLTVTNPVNGCTSTASVTVIENIATPGATASVSGPITCTTTTVTLTGNSLTPGVTYSWTGPGSFTSTLATPTVSVAGIYNLTVTDPTNGCTSTASVTVIENIATPGATASVSGPITCTTITVTLTGNSITPGVTYSWTGPGSFTSTLATPTVSVAGIYNLTVTDPTNGCTSTASVTVIENITAPGATASVSGPITCTTTTVTLTGASSTTGVTYSWTGPGSFTSTSATPTVSVAGTYNLTVTNPANGCTSTATVNVIQDITTPGATASVSGPITCTTTSVTLTGTSITPGVNYSWTGPAGFTSALPNPVTSTPGSYTVTITNPVNGCVSTASINVLQNITPPGATASVTGTLTCSTTSLVLTGTSPTTGVAFSWTGPGGFTSTAANPSVTAPGSYTLTVTDPANGCTSTSIVDVLQNIIAPQVSTSASGSLTCTITSVTLTGTSTTTGVTYSWTGPGGFNATTPNATASLPGNYTLTVTNPVNGCTATSIVNVIQNATPPGATADVSSTLTCTNNVVTLTGASSTPGVTFSWTGPGGFTSTVPNPTTSTPGNYTVTVTNPANGCISTASVNVVPNNSIPVITTAKSGDITCTNSSVTLNVNSVPSGVTYLWSGPGGFSSALKSPVVSVAGNYTVVVTVPSSGCSSTGSISVIENTTPPDLTATGGEHTCITIDAGGLVLSANSSVPGAQYFWTVPDGTEEFFASTNEQTLSIPFSFITGEFTVTVTNPATGCVNSETVTVTDNSEPPSCFITFRTSNSTLSVEATPGATYVWDVSNPAWSIVSGQGTPEIVVSFGSAGIGSESFYGVVVTKPDNGCSEDCSVRLTRTSGGIVASAGGSPTLAAPSAKPQLQSNTDEEDNEESLSSEQKVSVYPNPFSEKTTIEFVPRNNGYIKLEVYSFIGDKITTLFEGEAKAGKTYKAEFNARHLAHGMYYYRLSSKKKLHEGKLILAP